jgi:hypothetical protein
VGLNPAVYWMNVSDASYYIFNEKGNKGSQMGHTKKNIFKKYPRITSDKKIYFLKHEEKGQKL